jgi:hypothetical protein
MSFLVLSTISIVFAASGILMLIVSYMNDVKTDRMMEISPLQTHDRVCTFNYTTRWYNGIWFECSFPMNNNTICGFIQPMFSYVGRDFENRKPDPTRFKCFNLSNDVSHPSVNLALYIIGSIFCLPFVMLLFFVLFVMVQTFQQGKSENPYAVQVPYRF